MKLDWTHHVKVLSCRVCSTVRSLQILGNSVWGLSYARWHTIFHSVILPILTYAAPVWWYKAGQKGLADILQVAQNNAVRRISGGFKTTPIRPLHNLTCILPISLTLTKL